MAEIPIRDVRLRLLHGPLREPIAMSFGQLDVRPMALIEVEAEDGTVGLGESWVNYPPWAARERAATIEEGVAPLLRGRDAADVGLRWQEVHDALAPLGRQWGAPGPIYQALSGADIALWDLVVKVRGVPIPELLGGRVRDMVPVYASSSSSSA